MTQEQLDFLRITREDWSISETTELFNYRFKKKYTVSGINSALFKHGIKRRINIKLSPEIIDFVLRSKPPIGKIVEETNKKFSIDSDKITIQNIRSRFKKSIVIDGEIVTENQLKNMGIDVDFSDLNDQEIFRAKILYKHERETKCQNLA